MHKRHYEKAAKIVRDLPRNSPIQENEAALVRECFVQLFSGDNPRFDRDRFREACEPK